jgi:signal transduction histidine kinase
MSADDQIHASLRQTSFERFWRIAGAVSIRTKILGMVLGLVALMAVSTTVQVRGMLTNTLDAQLRDRTVSAARDLAARSTDLILVNDVYALHALLRDTLDNNPDVRYAFVIGPQGQVLAHTFGDGFPAGLLELQTVAPDAHHASIRIETEEGPIWDTAVPIFGKQAGVARVGLSERAMRQTIDSVTGQLLLTAAMISVIGITAAALLTWMLTRPIVQLARAAQAVGHGDLAQHVPSWADDEIGELARAFNWMIGALRQAATERAEREQLRALYVNGVIAAQEDERRWIARELHDSTSQSLTTLLVGLRTLRDGSSDPAVHQHAEDLRTIAGHALDEVRTLARHLRPSVLDDLGLAAAIERYVADCRQRNALPIDMVISGLADERLPPEIETALYRIVQEALTNIVRHAHARAASVFIERRGTQVRAIIEDDGIGFDVSALTHAEGHLGLHGIRERAELLGGRLTIETEPGLGTSLFVELPLPSVGIPDAGGF